MRVLVKVLAVGTAALALQGCIVKSAVDVATMPVRAAGKAVDLATTSQSEADEKRGRELRRREERLGQLERAYPKQYDACEDGDDAACAQARATWDEMQALKNSLPPPPPEPD